jgi:hypothetical protein
MNSRLPLCIASLVVGLPDAAQDWPRYGYDGALTGRTPARGTISAPRVAWTFPLAGCELRVALQPVPGKHHLTLDAAARFDPGSAPLAPAGPIRLDLDGRGTMRPR